jgi:type IV secretory pathway VirB3-like protein
MADPLDALRTMPHLEELHQSTQAAHRDAQTPPANASAQVDQNDPRLQERYSFAFSWTNKRGKVFEGQFVNKILTIGEKMSAGVTRARMQMGVPLEALSLDTHNLLFMTTWLQQSLVEKPTWASDLLALSSEELVRLIFAKVDDHERYFRGDATSDSPGEESV